MNIETNKPKPVSDTTVLVTGGTGFVAGHAILRLLGDGYRVRTTVRSAGREAEVREIVTSSGTGGNDRLEVVSAELTSDAGWDAAVSATDYVLHVASPFTGSGRDDDAVIVPARDGALRVLAAARNARVRRVVMTSSFGAVGYSRKPPGDYTEADWTDPADDNTAYIKSKAIAELAAWDFIRAEGGDLELTVINPTGIFGPVLTGKLSGSVGIIKAMLDGHMPAVPRMYFGVADVRDVADIHVRAMTSPAAAGQRFLATSLSLIHI